ncbi:PepSY domain-containing protein [Massilia kyonggiensis]|nr:PepSY domain-containing protein [Massilia kyonggiensis]
MRRLISWLHRYVGLAAAVVLVMSGITGALITFDGEIGRATHPELRRVEPRPAAAGADTLAASAREAWTSDPVRMLVFPESPGDAVEVWYRGSGMRAYLDPYDGHVLGLRDTHDSLMGILVDLHTNLLAGETGRAVIGWFGLAAVLLVVLGIWLWWPRRGRWRQALTVKWEAGAGRVWLDVHKVAGVVTGVFLVVIAATGAALALPNVVTEPLLVALTGAGAKQAAPASSSRTGPPASLDTMVQRAGAAFPEGRITRLMLPASPKGAVTVRMRLPGEIHQVGRTFIHFDRYDGRLLRADNVLESNLATRINAWFYPLHTGVYGGTATRVLNVLFGLSLALISLSGGWMWVRNRLARKRAEANKRGRAQVTSAAN